MRVLFLFSWVLLSFQLSCTRQEFDEPLLRKSFPDDLFGECSGGDGSVRFSAYEKEKKWLGGVFDYNFSDPNKSMIEWDDPLGKTLLRLDIKPEGVTRRGAFKGQFSSLEVNPVGELTFKKYSLGFKQSELGCLVKGVFPSSWRMDMTRNLISQDSQKVTFATGDRSVELVKGHGTHVGRLSGIDYCARVSWSTFWGFKTTSLNMCSVYKGRQKMGSFIEWSHYTLVWEHLHE